MTTVSILPTAWRSLHEALQTRRPVFVTYHERRRLLCPHALGWRAGRPMLLGYQTGGQTSTGTLDPDPNKRWRLMFIDEIDEVTNADPKCGWATANNYNAKRPFPVIDEVFIAVDLEPSPTQQ
jgi:hypothetical protein